MNVKDSFTQINIERERERAAQQEAYQAEIARKQKEQAEGEAVKRDLYALFGDSHANKRGKALEGVLGRFFKMSGPLIKEAFTVVGGGGQGIVEQIDGAIQCRGDIYLVEMKWWNQPIGPGEVNSHLSRLMVGRSSRSIHLRLGVHAGRCG